MRIALLGGSGDIGEGLALRFGRDTSHDIVIGSREPEKAREAAESYEAELDDRGVDAKLTGFENEMAADRADVVVLAVPPYHVADTVDSVADSLGEDDIIVSPATGMQRDEEGFHYHRPEAGSVTALAAGAAPDSVPVGSPISMPSSESTHWSSARTRPPRRPSAASRRISTGCAHSTLAGSPTRRKSSR